MHILFDNNAFANLTQEPQRVIHLQKLKEVVDARKVVVVGCCSMLQELAGLAKANAELYLRTLSEYEQLIQGRLLQRSDTLLIAEGQQLKPLDLQASLLDEQSVQNLLSNLKDPSNAESLFTEAKGLKQDYSPTMETAHQTVLEELYRVTHSSTSIATLYKDWFENYDAEVHGWFVAIFKLQTDFPVQQLPHVSAFLGYALTRIYERQALNKKDKDNDLFDRAYFTDAAVVDVLVTNDGPFIRTAQRVPHRTFDIVDLDEFAQLTDNWHAD
ncbi:MAG: hypothetical protein ABSD47_21005 [Candidatus Methylomirabilota bacterium]|jgi:hypothetical protein